MSDPNDSTNNDNIEDSTTDNINNKHRIISNDNNKEDNVTNNDYNDNGNNKNVKELNEEITDDNQQADQDSFKNSIESLKGRIIASAKLLKFAESSRSEIETERSKANEFNKQLEQQKVKYATLEEKLKVEKAKNLELLGKISQLEKKENAMIDIQKELKTITDQKINAERQLSNKEMYISQLEAEIKNMENSTKQKENKAQDKKDKQIKDLQNQLRLLQKKYEAAEEDKMETNIHYEMLQRDFEEKSQQLNQLKELQKNNYVHKATMTIDHPTYQVKTNVPHSVKDAAYEVLNQKLQQSHNRIESLNMEIQRLNNLKQPTQLSRRHSITDQQRYNGLLAAFKKCLGDMELMKKEKRVLQDKLTEQLLLNEDMKNEKHNSTLAQYGLYTSYYSINDTNTDIPAITSGRDVDNQIFEEIDTAVNEPSPPIPSSSSTPAVAATPATPATTVSKHKQPHPQSLAKISKNTKKSDNETRNMYGPNGLVIPESQVNTTNRTTTSSRKPRLSKLEKVVGVRRPATLGTTPTKRKLEMIKPPRKQISLPDSLFSSSSSSSSSSLSSSSSSSSSTPSSPSSTVGSPLILTDSEDNEEEDLEDLEDAPPTKRQVTLPQTSTQTVKNVIMKKQEESPTEFIIGKIKRIGKLVPTQTINYLNDMESYLGKNIDLLLIALEAFYKSLKSSANPFAKTRYSLYDDTNTFGVPDQLEIECPRYIDINERTMAWFLWALITLYPKDDPYTKMVNWAYDAALISIQQSKSVISCRYIRLLTILCRNARDRQRISTFCFDVIRCTPRTENIIHPMLSISVVWPSILDLGENGGDSAAGINMIIKAIQRSCGHYCNNQTTEFNVDEINSYMMDLVHWPALTNSQSLKDYIQELKTVLTLPDIKLLHGANKDAFNDFCINLIKAIELSAWRLNDWNWIYNDLIIKDLWQLMRDDVLSNTSLYLMGLLARCYLPPEDSNEQESEGLKFLRKTFNNIIEVGNDCIDDEFPLQITAVECIIMMSNCNMEHILPVIKWYDQLKPSFYEKLTPDIHENIQKLKAL